MSSSSSTTDTPRIRLGRVDRKKIFPYAQNGTGCEYAPTPLKLEDRARERVLSMPGVRAQIDAAKARLAMHPSGHKSVLLAEVVIERGYFEQTKTNQIFEVSKIQFLSDLEDKGQVMVYWPNTTEPVKAPVKANFVNQMRKRQPTSHPVVKTEEVQESNRTALTEEPNAKKRKLENRELNTDRTSSTKDQEEGEIREMTMADLQRTLEESKKREAELTATIDRKDRAISEATKLAERQAAKIQKLESNPLVPMDNANVVSNSSGSSESQQRVQELEVELARVRDDCERVVERMQKSHAKRAGELKKKRRDDVERLEKRIADLVSEVDRLKAELQKNQNTATRQN